MKTIATMMVLSVLIYFAMGLFTFKSGRKPDEEQKNNKNSSDENSKSNSKEDPIRRNISYSELESCFKDFGGFGPDTFMVISHSGSDKFVQFMKYREELSMEKSAEELFWFDFPNAHWSECYLEPMKKALTDSDYEIQVQERKGIFGSAYVESISVGDIKTIEDMLDITHSAFAVLGLGDEDTFTVEIVSQ